MPDTFAYLNVLIAIVLGLAIANLLGGCARLMHARERVVMYGPPIFWAFFLFIVIVQDWWSDYDLRHFPNLGFVGFLSALLAPVVLSLLCALVLPASALGGTIDLRTWYFSNRRWFFGLLGALVPASYVFEFFAKGSIYKGHNESVFLGAFLVLSIIGFMREEPRVHAILPVATAVVMCAYIGLLFMNLRGF